MTGIGKKLALLLAAAGLITACQPQPAPESARQAASWPAEDYRAAAAAGKPVFRLDPARSRIDIVVRRAGPLAKLGHDHVISVQAPEGFLLLGADAGGTAAGLRFRVADLRVDPPDGRARYALETQPDAKAIDGTRKNLLQHVLVAERWPFVRLHFDDFQGQGDQWSARVTIEVNGRPGTIRFPFRLEVTDTAATAQGTAILSQTELGIEPFSALGGALRVADEMEIHFQLTGLREK